MSHLRTAPEALRQFKPGVETIPVSDPVLRLIVLSQLAASTQEPSAAEPSEAELCEATDDAIARIRALPFADLVRLAEVVRSPSIQIRVDLRQLSYDVSRYDHLQASTAMYKYFIRAEASVAMMIELFKTTSTAVKVMQASLGVTTRVGRRVAPNDDTRREIIDEWQRVCDRHPGARERYYALHRRFPSFTMAQLHGVINSCQAQHSEHDERHHLASR